MEQARGCPEGACAVKEKIQEMLILAFEVIVKPPIPTFVIAIFFHF